jgi:hypothetical protein
MKTQMHFLIVSCSVSYSNDKKTLHGIEGMAIPFITFTQLRNLLKVAKISQFKLMSTAWYLQKHHDELI